MLDYLRDIGKSAENKRTEALGAYLDGALPPRERQAIEALLQQDAALRAELEQLRVVKQAMRTLPSRRVPRSFSLDPALYGPPKPQRAQQVYPLLRGATVLTALLFVVVLGLNLLNVNLGGQPEAPAAVITSADVTEQLAESAVPAPAAELELQPAPEAAEAAIAIEESAVVDEGQSLAAGAELTEESAAAPAEESAAAAGGGERPAADILGRKELSGTVEAEALSSAYMAMPENEAAAPAESTTTGAFDLPPGQPVPQPAFSLGTIALWLGVAALVLGLITLLVRSRT